VTDHSRKSWRGALAALAIIAALFIAAQSTRAQGTAAQPPQRPPQVLLKLDVVLSRFQGDKKISSLPYVIWLTSNGNQSVRMGANVPVGSSTVTSGVANPTGPAGGPNGSRSTSETTTRIEYRYVGTAIDAQAGTTDDGRFSINLSIEDSSIFTADGDAKPTVKPGEPMAFRSFSMSNRLLLRDGQTQQFTLATDKISGETLKVDATLNVMK